MLLKCYYNDGKFIVVKRKRQYSISIFTWHFKLPQIGERTFGPVDGWKTRPGGQNGASEKQLVTLLAAIRNNVIPFSNGAKIKSI